MVDVDLARPPGVLNALGRVGVGERAGPDATVVQVGLGGQVAGEDAVTG